MNGMLVYWWMQSSHYLKVFDRDPQFRNYVGDSFERIGFSVPLLLRVVIDQGSGKFETKTSNL